MGGVRPRRCSISEFRACAPSTRTRVRPSLTRTGAVLGMPAYMPLNSFAARVRWTRADVYALGVSWPSRCSHESGLTPHAMLPHPAAPRSTSERPACLSRHRPDSSKARAREDRDEGTLASASPAVAIRGSLRCHSRSVNANAGRRSPGVHTEALVVSTTLVVGLWLSWSAHGAQRRKTSPLAPWGLPQLSFDPPQAPGARL